MDHWEQSDKDRWAKEQDEGVVFREENWAKCATLAKKVASSFIHQFDIQLNVPRAGKGNRGLELQVVPKNNKNFTYAETVLNLKEVKAYVSGFKEAYQSLTTGQ